MAKRLIDILRTLARELIEEGYDTDDALKKTSVFDIDFITIKEELMTLELLKYIDDAEIDTIKALLSYILIHETEIDIEDVYAFIFGRGRYITWN